MGAARSVMDRKNITFSRRKNNTERCPIPPIVCVFDLIRSPPWLKFHKAMRHRLTVLLLTLALGALPAHVFAQTSDPNEIFAKAYGLYTKGKSSDAKEFFERITDPKFRLADYSQYYLAVINYDLGNWEQARQALAQLKQRFPQSIWIQPATLLQAKIDLAEKNYGSAEETLRQLRAEKTANREITEEAQYLQAQIREAQGDPIRAHA